MRILCGIDTQFTGEVMLTSDKSDAEYDDALDRSFNVDNLTPQDSFDSSNPRVLTPTSERKKMQSDLQKSKINTDQEFDPSSSVNIIPKFSFEVITPQSHQGRGHSSELAIDIESEDGLETRNNGTERVENNTTKYPFYLLPFSCFTTQWWREIGSCFVISLFQLFAIVWKYIKRKEDYYFPPKGGVQRCVGWCSQEDALFDYLTVREHIELFDDLLGGLVYEVGSSGVTESSSSASIPAPVTASTSAPSAETANGHLNNKTNAEHGSHRDSYCTFISNKLISFLRESDSRKNLRSSQEELLTRLGMTEHSEKYALELSGSFTKCMR